jgi:hypothetical protein
VIDLFAAGVSPAGHFQRGRFEEAAKAAYRSVLSNPAHGISYMLLAAAPLVDCAPSLAASLSEALRDTGLPE